MKANSPTAAPALNHRNILHLVRWVCEAHNLAPIDVRFEANAVAFRLVGTERAYWCWANAEGLKLGGKGLIAGTLTEALVATCYSVSSR